MCGSQGLAQAEAVNENRRLPSGWWSDQLYPVTGGRHDEDARLWLVALPGPDRTSKAVKPAEDLGLAASPSVERWAR